MTRSSSLILIAAIAITSFLTVPAIGQFSMPKIKIPKIPKVVPPTTPTGTDSVTPESTDSVVSNSDSSSRSDSSVRGRPISGARITFSNNPDGSNPKTSFTSSEYIYGRLDLGGKTVYDAFGLKNQTDVPMYYIHYDLNILKPGEAVWDHWGGAFNETLISKEDAQKTYWNFDVLPDPSKISTIKSMLANEKDFSKRSYAGIYTKWYDADSARSVFPQSGQYTIDVTIWGDSYDDWGKPNGQYTNYPTASAQFAFQFTGSDGQTLLANQVKANKTITDAQNKSEMYHAIPDWWYKPATGITDPRLSAARLVPMIKSYISQWNLTYVKHMIYPISGPMWVIEKNDLGIPRYRRFTSAIYILYREPKDNSCQIGYLTMTEPYAGGGTYSSPTLSGISDLKYIDCAVVK